MQILELLKHIWLTGADVRLDNGDVNLVDYEDTPKEIIEMAQNHVEEVKNYLLSWKDANAVHQTMRKVLNLYCGWQVNEKISDWLNNVEESLLKFHDWTVMLAENGWSNIYEDFREFETDESYKVSEELYKSACAFMRKEAKK